MQLIEGIAYLLVTERDGLEYVLRYSRNEAAELFAEAELKALARGGELIRGTCRYVDMVAAARGAR